MKHTLSAITIAAMAAATLAPPAHAADPALWEAARDWMDVRHRGVENAPRFRFPELRMTRGRDGWLVPAQESLLRPNCQGFFKTKTDSKNIDGSEVWVTTKLNARQCYGPGTGNRWVDPVNVEFSFNKEGGHESCGFFDIFEGVHYDLYLKDSTDVGRNYHLPRVRLGCETDTTGWTIESLRDAPSDFRFCIAPPQWKTNWTIERDHQNDTSGSHGGPLWDFQGPVKSECGH